MSDDTRSVAGGESAARRCAWAVSDLAIAYHDEEWGVALQDDRGLFEFLILEGAQAGLSWETILRKREAYRAAFDNFEIEAVAGYDQRKVEELMANAGIIRKRRKIEAAIQNARAVLAIREAFGSFETYLLRFVGGGPRRNGWQSLTEIPAHTARSGAMRTDLRRRGCSFVGSTICYALMQATGMVNDHVVECFRYGEIG